MCRPSGMILPQRIQVLSGILTHLQFQLIDNTLDLPQRCIHGTLGSQSTVDSLDCIFQLAEPLQEIVLPDAGTVTVMRLPESIADGLVS